QVKPQADIAGREGSGLYQLPKTLETPIVPKAAPATEIDLNLLKNKVELAKLAVKEKQLHLDDAMQKKADRNQIELLKIEVARTRDGMMNGQAMRPFSLEERVAASLPTMQELFAEAVKLGEADRRKARRRPQTKPPAKS